MEWHLLKKRKLWEHENKINSKRQPERIKIKTVNQTASFNQVMSGFGMPKIRQEELAILNVMLLTEQV